VAATLALRGGRPRRAALLGPASIGLASATVNIVAKRLLRRARPDQASVAVPADRTVRMPGSTSFPSGHSASAFAFATAGATSCPWPGCRCTRWPRPSPIPGSTPGCTIPVTPSSARSWARVQRSPSGTPAGSWPAVSGLVGCHVPRPSATDWLAATTMASSGVRDHHPEWVIQVLAHTTRRDRKPAVQAGYTPTGRHRGDNGFSTGSPTPPSNTHAPVRYSPTSGEVWAGTAG
jgi:hypothetical protein